MYDLNQNLRGCFNKLDDSCDLVIITNSIRISSYLLTVVLPRSPTYTRVVAAKVKHTKLIPLSTSASRSLIKLSAFCGFKKKNAFLFFSPEAGEVPENARQAHNHGGDGEREDFEKRVCLWWHKGKDLHWSADILWFFCWLNRMN